MIRASIDHTDPSGANLLIKKTNSFHLFKMDVYYFILSMIPGSEEQLESNMEALQDPPAVSVWRRHGETYKSKYQTAAHTFSHI